MKDTITIPKEVPQDSALSYEFLRAEGMKLIQNMAGNTWTDHNIHDPGITILEQVCYAITDLAYRMEYDIQDIIGSDTKSTYDALYSPATILTTNPVTLLDIRKIVIDVEGVKNAWIEKVNPQITSISTINNTPEAIIPKGLFRVSIEKDGIFDIPGSKIITAVKEKLYRCRSICEDFEEIKLLDTQKVRLQGAISISDTVDDVDEMIAHMLHRVGTHFSPPIPFYTLQQQLDKGKTTDEIFDGPRLVHGFIEKDDLNRAFRRRELQTSDVIKEIMDQTGIQLINKLALATGTNTVKNWVLPLDPSKTPILDIEGSLTNLSFTSKGLIVNINKERIKTLYNQIRTEEVSRPTSPEVNDIILPETNEQALEKFYPIQNQFPMNYGIGETGLPDSATPLRKSQAKQLSAYLLFFEQTLANYFSQLSNFKNLMSFHDDQSGTYANQNLLSCVPGMSEVLKDIESYDSYLQETTVDSNVNLVRKNKFLNHLLARFAEKFTSYGMVLKDLTNDQLTSDKKLIKDKARFLREYPIVSACKAKAFDLYKNSWNTENISGLERRIALKIGIENYHRRDLSKSDTAGLHMVEHILLRPRKSYNYPFKTTYTSFKIERFDHSNSDQLTRCISKNHTLHTGEAIEITGNEQYNGTYIVQTVGTDFFEIKASFQVSASGGLCMRTPDIRYYLNSAAIKEFKESPQGSDHTFCKVGMHTLKVGDRIEITQTASHNGLHVVTAITQEGFEVEVPFKKNEAAGRWMNTQTPQDPYSLQLTFVLPSWIERYQDSDFKKFIALTIREETPVHIRTNIQWLDQTEMQNFERAYQRFITQIHNR